MAKINEIIKYNLFAILALIFTFVFYPLGLIFAFVALSQIKKTKEKGRWMALIPIWVGVVLIVLILIGIIWVVIRGLVNFPI